MLGVSKLNLSFLVTLLFFAWGCSTPQKPVESSQSESAIQRSSNGIEFIQKGGGAKVILLFNSEGSSTQSNSRTDTSETDLLIERIARNAEIWAIDTAQDKFKEASLTSVVTSLQEFLESAKVFSYHLIALEETAAIGSVLTSSSSSVLSVSLIAPIFYDNSEDDLPLSLTSRESRRALARIHQHLETEEDSKTLLRSIEKFKLSTVPKILFYSEKALTVDRKMAHNFRSTFNRIQIIDASDKNSNAPLSINKIAARITSDLSKSH